MSRSRDGVTTVTLVVLCQVFHTLTLAGIALFLPLIRDDLQISFAQAGALSAAATLSYAAGQIPAGYLADRFGPRRLFFIGLMGWSTLSLLLALVDAYAAAIVSLLFAGAFRALIVSPGLALLSSWFPSDRRATAISLFMVGGFCGNVVLALAGPWLAMRVGWRWAFVFFAALGIVAALGFGAFAREKSHTAAGEPIRIADALALLRHKVLWVCSAIQFVRFSVITAYNLWLPSLLLTDRSFSLGSTGLILAMSAAFAAPSNALGGYVSDRLRNPPLVIGASLAILACTSVLLVQVESTAALLLVIATSSVFAPLFFGPLFFVPIEVLGQRTAGTVVGFANLFANIGGVATACTLGVVKDANGSFTAGFNGIGVLCAIGVALSAVLSRVRTRALSAQSRVREAMAGAVKAGV